MNGYSNNKCRFLAAIVFHGMLCLILGIKAFHSHQLKIASTADMHVVSLADQGCSICEFNFGTDADVSHAAPDSVFSQAGRVFNCFPPQHFPVNCSRLALTRGPPFV